MAKSRKRKTIEFAIKALLTTTALFFVFTKIDPSEFWGYLQRAHWGWLVAAFVAFNISKSISAIRLNRFYRASNTYLTEKQNWQLYYLGMFYNMFLPGSISGDGYKVYLLNQNYDTKLKHLASATLLERLSGLTLLVLLTCLIVYLSSFDIPTFPLWVFLPAIAAITALPAFYFLLKWFFPIFKRAFLSTSILSFWVQIGQLICAYFILQGLSIGGNPWDYLTLFMLSSVAAVLPLTIFGLGAREMVFLYGNLYLNINEEKAIAFTMLFFLIMASTSLLGLAVSYNLRLEDQRKQVNL